MTAGRRLPFLLTTLVITLLFGTFSISAQQTPDPRIADLVAAGKVRVGLFLPQYRKDPATGEPKSAWVDLSKEFAKRVGVPLVIVEHKTPVEAIACLKDGACDLMFLPSDGRVAGIGALSDPILQFDYTLLVPPRSQIQNLADADRSGIRIAGVRSHASTSELRSQLKQAELVYAETPEQAFDLLRTGKADVMESTRYALLALSPQLPGSRVIESSFGGQMNRMVVPIARPGWLAFVNEFVANAKASGLIQKAIERSGPRGVMPAP